MSSEAELDLPEQPGDTCPMVDSVISMIKGAERVMEGYERLDKPDDLKEVIDGIERELFPWSEDAEDKLESIRAHVTDIREWGQAWKDLAKDLIAEKAKKAENNPEAA